MSLHPRTVILAALSGVTMVLALASPASADHDNYGTDPDNRNQAIRKRGLTGPGDVAANHGKAQLERSVITTSWGSNDVDVFDDRYGSVGWSGKTDCTDWNVLWTSCNVIRIRFNESSMAGGSQGDWQSLGCHEFGHSGDIGHRSASSDRDNNSCMREDIWPLTYDTHDINAINASV